MVNPRTLLPDPDSPTRPSISPGVMSRDTPRNACTSRPLRRNVTCRSVIAATGAASVAGLDDAASTSDTALPIHSSLVPPACQLTVFMAARGGGGRFRNQKPTLPHPFL